MGDQIEAEAWEIFNEIEANLELLPAHGGAQPRQEIHATFNLIVKASEILEPRWTLAILTEMWCGSTRFNEIRRGVPGISPTLLSKRLKELEEHGLVKKLEDKATGTIEYIRTEKAIALEPAIDLLGEWAHSNIEAEVSLSNINPGYLMWGLRRKIDGSHLPERRVVIRFRFSDVKPSESTFWLIYKPGQAVDLCVSDPSFDVDLYIEAEAKALAAAFMGWSTFEEEIASERVMLTGDPLLTRTIDRWLVRSSYAGDERASTPA